MLLLHNFFHNDPNATHYFTILAHNFQSSTVLDSCDQKDKKKERKKNSAIDFFRCILLLISKLKFMRFGIYKVHRVFVPII